MTIFLEFVCFSDNDLRLDLFQGIPWHIIGYKHLIKTETGELQVVNTFHVFVMLKKENKEAAVNVALMARSLEIFSISNPQIASVSITSDNAG